MRIYRQRQKELDRIATFLESLSDKATEELRMTLNEGRRKSDQQSDEPTSDAPEGTSALAELLGVDQSTVSQTTGGPIRYKRRELEKALRSAWKETPPLDEFHRDDAYAMLEESGFQFKGPDKEFTLRAISRTLTTMSKREDVGLEQVRPNAGSNPAVYRILPEFPW